MINTTAPTDVLTAIAIVRRLVAGLFGTDVVAAELDLGLELGGNPERPADEEEDSDTRVREICVDESGGRVIEVALSGLEFMVNRLMGSASGQQLLLCGSRSSPFFSDISQHNKPPSAAQLSEHCHIAGPWFVKSRAPPPLNSSSLQTLTFSIYITKSRELHTNFVCNIEGSRPKFMFDLYKFPDPMP
jgi:hypothetical protein